MIALLQLACFGSYVMWCIYLVQVVDSALKSVSCLLLVKQLAFCKSDLFNFRSLSLWDYFSLYSKSVMRKKKFSFQWPEIHYMCIASDLSAACCE